MAKIDLSSVLKPPKVVEIRGEDYKLPGDIPIELVALIEADEPEGEKEKVALYHQLSEEVGALFRVYQPDLERMPLGLEEAVRALGLIYQTAEESEDEAGADPTQANAKKVRAQSGTKSTKSTPKGKPKSSASASS
jgi:hypothetical protein